MFSIDSALIGFLFAISSALIVQGLVARVRKVKLASVARDMVVTETIHNLRSLTFIGSSIDQTVADASIWTQRSTAQLRLDIHRQLINPETIDALSPRESSALVENYYQLVMLNDAIDTFYDRYEDRIKQPQQGDSALKVAHATWQHDVAVTKFNLMNLLLFAVHNQKQHISRASRQLAEATKEQRYMWQRLAADRELTEQEDRIGLVGATRDLERLGGKDWLSRKQLVVCWEHDWEACPIKVQELYPIAFPEDRRARTEKPPGGATP